MKIFKTVEIPSKKIEIVDKEICDKCDKEIIGEGYHDAYVSNWFKVVNGYVYANDGFSFSGEKYNMDLCLDCSMELVENLKILGYKIQNEGKIC